MFLLGILSFIMIFKIFNFKNIELLPSDDEMLESDYCSDTYDSSSEGESSSDDEQ